MELVNSIIAFTQSPVFGGLVLALFTMSEALASIPGVKANSVFQLVAGVLARLAKKQPAV